CFCIIFSILDSVLSKPNPLMKYLKSSLFLCLLVTVLTSAQNKEITLDAIWNGTFRTEGMQSLHSMNNGRQYAVLNFEQGSTAIDVYDYKTLSKVETLVNSSDLDAINNFSDYTFSKDERKIILATEVEPIFRRSTLGVFYFYDISTKSLIKIADEKIQEPTLSPNGTKVAYGYKNNLYIKDLECNQTTQITFDGEKNKVINGI